MSRLPRPAARLVAPVRRVARAGFLRAPRPVRRFVLGRLGKLPAAMERPARQAAPAEDANGFNLSYLTARPDLLALLPMDVRRVLDLGCATGEVGAAIKLRAPGTRVVGVEIDPEMAALAAQRIDRVVAADLGDAAAVAAAIGEERFDAVVAGDILEHLVDPWRALRGIAAVVDADGVIVASLPNVGFWATWRDVVIRRRWPYRPRGVHDATHLRFFARSNVEPLFEQAGFVVERVERSYRLVDGLDERNRRAARLAVPGLRDLLTYQFLVIARRAAPADEIRLRERGLADGAARELLPPGTTSG